MPNPLYAHDTAPVPSPEPAWRDDELASDPHAHADKAPKVRAMFAAIARSYDLNNRVHSLWQDQRWRASAVRAAAVQRGDRVLDVACGTGDLTQAFARTPAAEIFGLDFTRPMLDIAEHKQTRLPDEAGAKIRYLEGDAMALPFENSTFDVLSIAFGIRNVQRPLDALAEFARVLKPAGRLVILEFDTPRFPPVRWFNSFYAGWVMPRTATLISRDKSGAYRYLPKSVGAFMKRDELAHAIEQAGFTNIHTKPLSLGICVRYSAVRV